MANTVPPAYSPYRGIAQMLGGQGSSASQGTAYSPTQGISQIVQALLASKAQQTPEGVASTPASPSPQNSLGTYEGNVATPANPNNNGVYGMQPQSGASSSYATQPPNPFGQGTSAVPYNDPTMSALFMPPPSWASSQTN